MKPRSSKAKGKRLEKWLKVALLTIYPELTEDDIRTTVGSETGADIKLSKKAKALVGMAFECKNRETFKTLYTYYDQASENADGSEPIVVIKMNNRAPLILVDASWFLTRKNNNEGTSR